MSGLLCWRGMLWATMLGRSSDLLSSTWWLTREVSWPELLVGGLGEWETKDTFFTTSTDLALWVRNDPPDGSEGARMARAEASRAMGRLVVEVLWDTMLFIISWFRLVMEVVE